MRLYRSTSIVMMGALGLLAPACDDEPEDPTGAAWVPPASGDSGNDAGSSGDDDDGGSGWSAGAGSGSDTWDESDGSTGGRDSSNDTAEGGTSGDDSSTSGEPGGESPYAGGWDVGACDSASGPGDTIVGTDQHGENVYLRDFCHKAVLFVLGNFP